MSTWHTYFARPTWNISRIAFLVLGIMFLVNAIWEGDWTIGILAGWLITMGIFRVGCAAGSCDYNPPSK